MHLSKVWNEKVKGEVSLTGTAHVLDAVILLHMCLQGEEADEHMLADGAHVKLCLLNHHIEICQVSFPSNAWKIAVRDSSPYGGKL